MGTILPVAVRIIGAGAVATGIAVEQLDPLFGGSDESPTQTLIAAPLLALFFLNLLMLAVGLWRIKEIPRYTPILLVIGTILFPVAQTPFEVNIVAYISSTACWLFALAPVGFEMLRSERGVAVAYGQ
jgi:hypothetical protein